MVWSLYFDTEQFELLRQKIEGNCDKRKIRFRWYDGTGNVYVEIKYRFGALRDKLRIETSVASETLEYRRLEENGELLQNLLHPLRAAGARLPAALFPMMTICFLRNRFVDPASGARVSVDEQITVASANRRFFKGDRPVPLPLAVVEVKGQGSRLSPSLSEILAVGARRDSVSKYLECYRLLRER
jgi:hypothetical protein